MNEADFDLERLRELKRQSLVVAQELIERRTRDPLRNFKPHQKQIDFIDAVLFGSVRENWFLAANRAGKSDAGAFIGSRYARFGFPPDSQKVSTGVQYAGGRFAATDRATSGWVVSVDFPSSRDVIQPKYFDNGFAAKGGREPFIPPYEIAKNGWRVSDQILQLKNGSIIGFKSCDSGRAKFQGADKDWIHFDEEPDHEVYKESLIRIGSHKMSIYGTCTILPEAGRSSGISWVYQEIVKPWKEGSRKVGLYNASIYDNPYLAPSEIAELESKYPEGSIERRIRLDGELLPGLLGARAYVPFHYDIHVAKQPDIDRRRPICWTHDFNVSPMISLICQREGGLFRVFREIVVDGEGIQGTIDRFCEIVPSHGAEVWIYGDATSRRRVGQTGKSDYYILLNGLKQYNAPVRLKVPEDNPRVVDRINAVNQTLRDSEGISCIEIDPSCVELIADLEQVVRDNRGGILKTNDQRNPYFRRTHASDSLGYFIAYEKPVRTKSLDRHGNQQRMPSMPEPKYSTARAR